MQEYNGPALDPTPEERGLLGESVAGFKRGGLRLVGMLGNVGRTLNPGGENVDYTIAKAGQGLKNWSDKRMQRSDVAPSSYIENHPILGNIPQAAEMVIPSVAVPLGAGLAATGVGAAPGIAIAGAGLAGAGLFGVSQYQDTKDAGIKAGLSPEEARSAGIKSGLVEGLGEGLSNLIPAAKVFKLAKPVQGAIVKSLFSNPSKTVLKQLGNNVASIAAGEVTTEMGQAYLEAKIDKDAGIRPDADPMGEAVDTIGPTLALSMLLGGPVTAANKLSRVATQKVLETPSASESARMQAVNNVHGALLQAEKHDVLPVGHADIWRQRAEEAVKNGEVVPIDDSYFPAFEPAAPVEKAKPEDTKADIHDALVQSIQTGESPLEVMAQSAADKIVAKHEEKAAAEVEAPPETMQVVHPQTGDIENIPNTPEAIAHAVELGYMSYDNKGSLVGDSGDTRFNRVENKEPTWSELHKNPTNYSIDQWENIIRKTDRNVDLEEMAENNDDGRLTYSDIKDWVGYQKDSLGEMSFNREGPYVTEQLQSHRNIMPAIMNQEGASESLANDLIRENRGRTENNASGESAASVEAMNRVKTENPRYVVDTRTGKGTPLKGVDAVDVQPAPHQMIMQRDSQGKMIVVAEGNKVTPAAKAKVTDRFSKIASNTDRYSRLTDADIKELNILRPALKVGTETHVGAPGEAHIAVAAKKGIKDAYVKGTAERGFVDSTGRFHGEAKAAEWLMKNDQDAYKHLKNKRVVDSVDYAYAKGLAYDAKFSRAESTGVPKAELEESLKSILPKLKIPVQILNNASEMPDTFKNPDGVSFNGVFHNGRIYLIASQLKSVEEAEAVLLDHEVRHAGLRAVLGGSYEPFMLKAYADQGNGIRSFAESKGIDFSTREGKLEAADEFIVSLAKEAKAHPLLDKIIAQIKEWLRNAGFDLRLSDAELRALVSKAGTEMFTKDEQAGRMNMEPATAFSKGETNELDISTRPVGERLRAMENSISIRTGVPLPRGTLKESGNDALRSRLSKVAGLFGYDVTLLDDYNGRDFDGFVSKFDKKNIYIVDTVDEPHLVTLGHELLHMMDRDQHDLYLELGAAFGEMKDDAWLKVYLDQVYQGELPADGNLPQSTTKEWIADIVGRNLNSEGFWKAFEEARPSLAVRVAEFIHDMIAIVKGKLTSARGFTELTIKDIRKAERLTADVMARFADRQEETRFNTDGKPVVWFSKMQRVLDEKTKNLKGTNVVPASHFEGLLKDMKKDEVGQSGIKEFLKEHPRLTKNELMDFLKENQVELKDVVLGGLDTGAVQAQTKELRAIVKDNDYLGYDTPGEAVSDLRDGKLNPDHVDWNTPEDKAKVVELIGRIKDASTHFSQYTEPGAKEGSYREMFVTAPNPESTQDSKVSYNDFFKEMSEKYNAVGRELLDAMTAQEKSKLDALMNKTGLKVEGWNDGHSQYADIQNPVVRIRFNERETDGKNILFVEEMQGPSDANQTKMPEFLRKRIYDLGVKRILAYAKEKGFAGVAWTPGEMQAERYDLSKQVSKVEYEPDTQALRTYGTDGQRVLAETVPPGKLEDYIGKEAARKLLGSPTYNDGTTTPKTQFLEGEGLKVGGEGLKRLYDQTLPALFKKYGGEAVGETKIDTLPGGAREMGDVLERQENPDYRKTPVPFVPITQATPDSMPLFNRLDDFKKFANNLSQNSFTKNDLSRMMKNVGNTFLEKFMAVDRMIAMARGSVWAQPIAGRLKELSELKTMKQQYAPQQMTDASVHKDTYLKAFKTDEDFKKGENVIFKATLYQLDPFASLEDQWKDGEWKPVENNRFAPALTIEDAKADLAAAFRKLSAPQREAVKILTDHIQKTSEAQQQAVLDKLKAVYGPDEKGFKDAEKAVKEQIKSLRGRYFPLIRFGNYMTRVWELDAEGNKVKELSAQKFETMGEALKAKAAAEAKGYHAENDVDMEAVGGNYTNVPSNFITKVEAKASEAGIEGDALTELKQELQKLWVGTLSPNTIEGHKLPRKGVEGFETDILRTYAAYISREARATANTKYGWQISRKYREMNKVIDELKEPGKNHDPEALLRMQNLVNHLESTDQHRASEKINPFVQWMNKLVFATMLSSPSAFVVQFSQPLMFTLPKLASRHGFAKASATLYQATKKYMSGEYADKKIDAWDREHGDIGANIVKLIERHREIDAEVKRHLEVAGRTVDPAALGKALTVEARKEKAQIEGALKAIYEAQDAKGKEMLVLRVGALMGSLELSRSHDLHDMVMGASKLEETINKGIETAGFFMRKGETGSRKAAAVSAFKLGYDGDFIKAMDYTLRDIIDDTLYDFSQENRPAVMRGNVGRLIGQFQFFRFHTIGKVIQLSMDAMGKDFKTKIEAAKGDEKLIAEAKRVRSEARKELAYMTGVSMALAGAAGAPLAMVFSNSATKLLMSAIAWMFEDPDDPWDFERDFSVALHSALGDTAANVFEKGLPTLLGVDISRRVGTSGMADMIMGEPPEGMTASQRSSWYANRLLGPWWSMVGDWQKSVSAVADGDMGDAVKFASPNFVKSFFKAYDLEENGVTTTSGKALMQPEDVTMYSVALMLVGINPMDVSLAREDAREISNLSTTLTQRRSKLLKDYAKAYVKDDYDGKEEALEKINAWGESQPRLKLSYKELASAVKRARQNAQGGKVSKKEQIIMDQYGLGEDGAE